jgi:hypothetical protein
MEQCILLSGYTENISVNKLPVTKMTLFGFFCVYTPAAAIICYHADIPPALVSFLHFLYVLVKSFPLFLDCYTMWFWVMMSTFQRCMTLKMVAACTSETSASSPTTTVCNNPRKEVTSITNHHESLKSVIFPFVHH